MKQKDEEGMVMETGCCIYEIMGIKMENEGLLCTSGSILR